VAYAYHPRYSRKHKAGESQSKLACTKNDTLPPENPKQKGADMAQVVEHQPSKHEALSSYRSTAKRNTWEKNKTGSELLNPLFPYLIPTIGNCQEDVTVCRFSLFVEL
jgi:hypothetical protein